jgi:hypothetical protein
MHLSSDETCFGIPEAVTECTTLWPWFYSQVPEDRVDEVRKTIGTILDSFKVPQ